MIQYRTIGQTIFNPNEFDSMLDALMPDFSIVRKGDKGKTQYVDMACSFDTETTSFYANGDKCAIMYVWMFGINGLVCVGRTWGEFECIINKLIERFGIHSQRRLICFVHNLSYDFQFFRKWFDFEKVFALDNRKPVYAIARCGIEFRCSYIQSGYSLATIGKNLRKYKVEKMVGDLNYDLIRNSETPLTDKEIGYCVNDVKVVCAYIAETAAKDGGLLNMPLTKTGYVRNYCRAKCFQARNAYMRLMRELTMTSDEYKMLKAAFQGGFTHTNPLRSNQIHYNVTSFDFNSSYPGVMIAEQFPMSKGEFVQVTDPEMFKDLIKYFACVFEIEFVGLEPKIFTDNYISMYKCWFKEGVIINNGRIAYADVIRTTITDVDFKIIRRFYKWEKMRVGACIRYKRDYLPTKFVESILDLYAKKTELKGVKGMEEEYQVSKGMLNSCYGMAVTDPVRDEWMYNEEWQDKPNTPDLDEAIEKYNSNQNRFLSYAWGIYVTAYARANLFTGIIEFGNDYIYSDTDSLKVLNADKHLDYINRYNENQRQKLYRACKIHGFDKNKVDLKGKLIGAWAFDGKYRMFKALGAKRYLVQYEDGHMEMTVAGLNKRVALPYMIKHFGHREIPSTIVAHEKYLYDRLNANRVFNAFKDDLYIPPGETGKKTHTYIDEEIEGHLTDYKGNTAYYHELSYIHLSPADYDLSISADYRDYMAFAVGWWLM